MCSRYALNVQELETGTRLLWIPGPCQKETVCCAGPSVRFPWSMGSAVPHLGLWY